MTHIYSPEHKGIYEYLNKKYKCKDNDELVKAALEEIRLLRNNKNKVSIYERANWYGWEESKY